MGREKNSSMTFRPRKSRLTYSRKPRVKSSDYLALPAVVDHDRMVQLGIPYGTQSPSNHIVMTLADWAKAREARAVEISQ